jgi:anaerobic selenocysteine-containing dehydrogenase
VSVTSPVGAVEAPVEVTADMMPGVVSLPHGWGHDRDALVLGVATAHAGVSINDLTDDGSVDAASGCASLDVPVTVTRLDPPA